MVAITNSKSIMPTAMPGTCKMSASGLNVGPYITFVNNGGYIAPILYKHSISDYNHYNCKISIPGWTIVDGVLGLDRHASYQIVCRYWLNGEKVNKLIVNRRYNDFYWFHQRLVRNHGDSAVPVLPPKQRQGRFDPKFIEFRRAQLEGYLRNLLVTRREELIRFLGGYKKGTKVITDGGPRGALKCLRDIKVKDNPPTRSCLAVGTARCRISNRVHFADCVLNNEKASRNPETREHVSQNKSITYHM